nr:hypothetical protein [Tanacetum cinerariifolium]
MYTRGQKKAIAKPAPPARDPRDVETIERLQQRSKNSSFKEEPIMFVEDESCPVYDTDNEKDVEHVPKYDSDGDELVYEDEE